MTAESNSKTAVESLVLRCTDSLQRGKQGGLASLEAHRDAGAALVELKDLLPHGKFGAVANERCGCSKQWRVLLMRLCREWGDLQVALRWAERDRPELIRKAYSVEGALAVLNLWRRVQTGDGPPSRSRTGKPSFASILRENARLKEDLSAAAAYIAFLEEKLDTHRPAARGEQQDEIDPDARDKIEKVAALWRRGGTDGERSAAVHRLDDIAQRYGRTFRDLLHECQIESPARLTFADTLNVNRGGN
jgi:hypothetical protein